MRDDDSYEGRLRELLRDPGWSLTPPPDAQAWIRRSARRQRVALTGLAACTGAAAATAVAVPLALSGAGSPPAPAAAGHVQATPLTQPKATSVLMPDVTGLKLKNAEAVIRSVTGPVHLVIRHVKVPHHGGTVVGQVPSPGARVSPDGQITITVTVYDAS